MRQDAGAEFISASLTLHLPDPVSGRCCDMSYYEFILALILVTGYIICVKKK